MKYANLHLHSTYSDAQFTPEQLVLIGKSLGYRALALTDHETDGGVREFLRHAEKAEIGALTGIEFYGEYEKVNLHLVALDYDMDNPALRAFVRERVELYSEYTRQCVEYGRRIGVIDGITWDDVTTFCGEGAWICIDSVCNAYRIKHIPIPENLRQDVFKAPETLAFKPKNPTAERVIRVIRGAGGIAGLAHPNNQTHFVPALVEMGLNGIEVCHPSLRDDTPQLALEAAETYRLYHCGGTDHTGPMSGCDGKHAIPVFNGVDEEEYFTIKERRLG